MPSLKKLLDPDSYLKALERRLLLRRIDRDLNQRAVYIFPPGHFYSPLLDVTGMESGTAEMRFDGEEMWEHIELRREAQRLYFGELVANYPLLSFPIPKSAGYRYYRDNIFFVTSDAFTLSGIIRKEKPRRIVEVGSGFSSAVMLDTLQQGQQSCQLTFIEPFPDRLNSLLAADDSARATVLVKKVQEIPFAVFEELEKNDVLFIDSSHVAKIGSDVTFLLLRVLPKLQVGVLVHIHDIFYPQAYPVEWIKEGRAWNETLFLRAFLLFNPAFEIVAFNSFAGLVLPDVFQDQFPAFLENTGGSIWLRKIV